MQFSGLYDTIDTGKDGGHMAAKYLALAQTLRQALPEWYARGLRRLPCEQELAEQYHVSRQTVRQALAEAIGVRRPRIRTVGSP